MYKGKVVESGDTEQVCDRPQHPYTQALLSAIPRPDPRQRSIHKRHRYAGEASVDGLLPLAGEGGASEAERRMRDCQRRALIRHASHVTFSRKREKAGKAP